MLATICGGGMVIMPTDLAFTPHAASQVRNHISCVPPGKVCANVTSFLDCTDFTAAATFFRSLNPTRPQKSFESVMAWPLLFNIMAMRISEPALPPMPSYTEKGIEKRQCAPSSSPFNTLSRTLAHEASLVT